MCASVPQAPWTLESSPTNFERLLTGNVFLFQRSTGTKHLLQTLKEYLAKTLHLGGILPFHPPKLWTILFYFDPVMI